MKTRKVMSLVILTASTIMIIRVATPTIANANIK